MIRKWDLWLQMNFRWCFYPLNFNPDSEGVWVALCASQDHMFWHKKMLQQCNLIKGHQLWVYWSKHRHHWAHWICQQSLLEITSCFFKCHDVQFVALLTPPCCLGVAAGSRKWAGIQAQSGLHDISSLTQTEKTRGIKGHVIVICMSKCKYQPLPCTCTYTYTLSSAPSIIHWCDLFICLFLFQNETVFPWVCNLCFIWFTKRVKE